MPPKAIAVHNACITISRTAFLPFCYDRLRDLMERRDTPDGENAILIYLMSTLKQCDGNVYYRRDKEGENLVLLNKPVKHFIDHYLASFKDKGIAILLNLSHRPFTTVFDPRMGLIDNKNYKINLYEPSPYAYVPEDYTTNDELLSHCKNFLFLLCEEDAVLMRLVGSCVWRIITGQRLLSALVFTGNQGTGKSTFCNILKFLVPPRLYTDAKIDQLGKNNGLIVHKSLVVIEEFPSPIPDVIIRALLNLVNGSDIVAQEKFVAAFSTQNFANFIFNGNQDLSALNGRRYCHIHPRAINPQNEQSYISFCNACSDKENNKIFIEHFFCLFRSLADEWTYYCQINNMDPSKIPAEYTIPEHYTNSELSPKIDPIMVLNEFFCGKVMAAIEDKVGPIIQWQCAQLATEYVDFCKQYACLNPTYTIPGAGIAEKKRIFYNHCTSVMRFSKIKNSTYYFSINGYVIFDHLMDNLDAKNKVRIDLYNLGYQNKIRYGTSKLIKWSPVVENDDDDSTNIMTNESKANG